MKITGRPSGYDQGDWRLHQYVGALPEPAPFPVLRQVLADNHTMRQWVCLRPSDEADYQPDDLVWWPNIGVLSRLTVNPADTSSLLAVAVTGFYEGSNPLFRTSVLLTPSQPKPQEPRPLALSETQVVVPCGAGITIQVQADGPYQVQPLPVDMRLALRLEEQPGWISLWRDPQQVAPRDHALLVVTSGSDLAVVEVKTYANCQATYTPPRLPESIQVPCGGSVPLPKPGGMAPVAWELDNAYDFDLRDGRVHRRTEHAAFGLLTVSDHRGNKASSRLVGVPCANPAPSPIPDGYPPCQWPAHLSPTNEGYTLAQPPNAKGTKYTTGKAYQEFLINSVAGPDLRPSHDGYVPLDRDSYVGVAGRLSLRLTLGGRLIYPSPFHNEGVQATAPLRSGDIVGVAVDLTQPHAPCWVHVNGSYLGGGHPEKGTSPTALLHYPGPLTPEAGGRQTVTLSRAFRYHPEGFSYFQEDM